MKVVNSTAVAVQLCKDLIQSVDALLEGDADANSVAILQTKVVVDNPVTYRDYILDLRNRAHQALIDLRENDSNPTPDISPRTA